MCREVEMFSGAAVKGRARIDQVLGSGMMDALTCTGRWLLAGPKVS